DGPDPINELEPEPDVDADRDEGEDDGVDGVGPQFFPDLRADFLLLEDLRLEPREGGAEAVLDLVADHGPLALLLGAHEDPGFVAEGLDLRSLEPDAAHHRAQLADVGLARELDDEL